MATVPLVRVDASGTVDLTPSLGRGVPQAADALNSLGLVAYFQEDYETALESLKRALDVKQQTTL